MTEIQRLDHGILSMPNRLNTINSDLDKYKAEQAKIAKHERDDKRFLADEREIVHKLTREQAEALYKQHGKLLRAKVKGKLQGTGNTPSEWLKIEARVNPERFIKLVEQILKESDCE